MPLQKFILGYLMNVLCSYFFKSIFGIGGNLGRMPPSLRSKNVLLELVESKPQGTHELI